MPRVWYKAKPYFTLGFNITREMVDDPNNPMYPPMPKPRRRRPKPEAPVPVNSTNVMGVQAGSVYEREQQLQPRSRVVEIPRNIIRTITECHYSDGTITKEDRTYPVPTTQTIYN